VGTSSVRRDAFLRAVRPDVRTSAIRGNVDTRLAKVERGEYGGTMLALAGLRRLDIPVSEVEILPLDVCPPAPGQGALALQCRADDVAARTLLAGLDHRPTRGGVEAERALLRLLGASCEIPLGAHGRIEAGGVVLDAALATSAGIRRTQVRARTAAEAAELAARGLGAPAHA